MDIPGTYPLQPVECGRMFFREFANGMAAFVGVVDVPANVPDETLMAARLNDKLWLDADHAEVEFVARYRVQGRGGRLHERSRFRRDAQGRWLYVDGTFPQGGR